MRLSIHEMRVLADSSVRLLISSGIFGDSKFVFNIAYDFGRAQSAYGTNSAVSAGLRKGLDDALAIESSDCSKEIVEKIIVLGRRHGTLFRAEIRLKIA